MISSPKLIMKNSPTCFVHGHEPLRWMALPSCHGNDFVVIT